jgi:spore germination cell wall hydrolase CwlJ-like protein
MRIAGRLRVPQAGLGLCLLLTSASCVPLAANRPTLLAVAADTKGAEAAPLPHATPPAPEPLELKNVAPETAVALNAAIPLSTGYNPAAPRFLLRAAGMADRMRSLECLATAIYYEAASEGDDGQRAVAQVVLNRVRHPTYPSSVCGVVYQGSERVSGCQFSFTCDGSLLRKPSVAGWTRARRIAAEALAGRVYAPVGHATHYHTHQVLPHWAPSLVKSAVIGAHIFYRWGGVWGTPSAFRQRYAGFEPLPGPNVQQTGASSLPSPAALRAEVAALLRTAASSETGVTGATTASAAPAPIPAEIRAAENTLPQSQVREAYRYSGMPLDQLPPGASAVK